MDEIDQNVHKLTLGIYSAYNTDEGIISYLFSKSSKLIQFSRFFMELKNIIVILNRKECD